MRELLEKRLVALYESGTTTYLDVLLSSESLSDFISKYYLIAQLADYDQELLERIMGKFHFWKKSSIVKRTEKYKSQNLIL